MKIGYFMINNEEIDIYDDGEIYSYGQKIGKIYDDGEIYVHNKKIGQVYNDGEIWINGRKEGQLYEDGQLWLSGRQVGNIDRPSQKDLYTPTCSQNQSSIPSYSHNSYQSHSSQNDVGIGNPFPILVAFAVAVFIVCSILYGSYKFMVGGMVDIFWNNQNGWSNIIVYFFIAFFYGSMILGFYIQYKMTRKERESIASIFVAGLFIQALMITLCVVLATLIFNAIIPALWEIILFYICAIFIGVIPSLVGTIIIKIFGK